jgi:hypothetical protein
MERPNFQGVPNVQISFDTQAKNVTLQQLLTLLWTVKKKTCFGGMPMECGVINFYNCWAKVKSFQN